MKRLLLAIALLLVWSFALAAININTATKDELDALPGIGPVKAQAIVDYRTANGPFKSPQDIMKVRGIKEGEFGKIKDQISVSGTTTVPAAPQRESAKASGSMAPAAPAKTAAPAAAAPAPATASAPAKDAGNAKTTKAEEKAARAKAMEDKAAKAKEEKAARAKEKEAKAAKAKEEKMAKAEAAKSKVKAPAKDTAAAKDAPAKDTKDEKAKK